MNDDDEGEVANMELSLEFLKACIGRRADVSLSGKRSGRRFRGIRLLDPAATPQPDMLYLCANVPDAFADWQASLLEGSGIVTVGNDTKVPRSIPTLRILNKEASEAFNLVNDTFHFFSEWQERVYERALEKPSLESFMELLNEVTPNPWYIADGSYRVLVARHLPDVEDISYIWRYLYRNKRLPLETVLAMEDMGKIEQMSKRKRAYLPSVEPFNIPFVSKSVVVPGTTVAHFYIIGVYTRLSRYEIEIADFVGDVLNQMLATGELHLPSMSRYYDSYLSDLISGDVPEDGPKVLARMYDDLGWGASDALRLVVLSPSGDGEVVSDAQRLLTLESRCSARGFFHDGHVAAVINLTRSVKGGGAGGAGGAGAGTGGAGGAGGGEAGAAGDAGGPDEDACLRLLRPLARSLRCTIGVSEGFRGLDGVMRLGDWYEQALFALQRTACSHDAACDQDGAEPAGQGSKQAQGALRSQGQRQAPFSAVTMFSWVALQYFQDRVVRLPGMSSFVHPALAALQAYDAKNRTSLCETLRVYLESGCNVTEAANLLFVHRNTLLKRMRKIRSLTSLNLDDAECRKRLIVSFLVTRGQAF